MKSTLLGKDAEQAVLEVVQDFEIAVGSTLGPNGDYAIISSGISSKVTKDGATVAKSIDYDNPHKAHIANIIREAAIKTETECGDGTTTTTLFACEFYKLLKDHNSFIEHAKVEELVERMIKLVGEYVIRNEETVRAAALISANNDYEMAGMVCDIVMENPGIKPDIKLVEGEGNRDRVERIEGHRIAVSVNVSPEFYDETVSHVFVYIDQRLADVKMFAQLISATCKLIETHTSFKLTVVFKSIEPTALSLNTTEMVTDYEKIKDHLHVCSANIGGGMSLDMLKDMVAITGGKVFPNLVSFMVSPDPLVVSDGMTFITNRNFIEVVNPAKTQREVIQYRQGLIKTELSELVGERTHTAYADLLRKRLAQLNDKHYIIHVGNETHSDYLERKDRFDDVITSAVTNVIHGVVPGANTSFLSAALRLVDEERTDYKEQGHLSLLDSFVEVFLNQTLRLRKGLDEDIGKVTDLVTGVTITRSHAKITEAATELNIYDPAYTVISALRGGFKTGQILAKTKSVIVSNRFGAQTI